jgi:hypothetical protein
VRLPCGHLFAMKRSMGFASPRPSFALYSPGSACSHVRRPGSWWNRINGMC